VLEFHAEALQATQSERLFGQLAYLTVNLLSWHPQYFQYFRYPHKML